MVLFPPDNKTTFEQGSVGDCSLLAVLDCVINRSSKGSDYIKSMFTQTEDGVVVRIKRTYHSENLKSKNLTQYRYYFDNATDEDVFFVSQEKCEQMEVETKGVQTNALAIKILERLCSYYFYNNWQAVSNSLEAHNMSVIRFADANKSSSLSFIAEWLSLDTQPIEFEDFWILKQLLSNLPVYLSFDVSPGCRHAFRLATIENHDTDPKDRWVVLRNPWDNRKIERYSLLHVRSRAPNLCLIKSDSLHYELACAILKIQPVLKVWFHKVYTLLIQSAADLKRFDAYYPEFQACINSFGDTLVNFVQEEGLSEQHVQAMRDLLCHYKEKMDDWASVKKERLEHRASVKSPPKKFQSASSAFTVWKRPAISPKHVSAGRTVLKNSLKLTAMASGPSSSIL